MKNLRRYVLPTLGIFLAGVVIILGVSILGNTDWADSLRANPSGDGLEGGTQTNAVLRWIDAFLKVVLFMGLPAFFTARILRISSRRSTGRLQEKGA
jgi:hypothetical protein